MVKRQVISLRINQDGTRLTGPRLQEPQHFQEYHQHIPVLFTSRLLFPQELRNSVFQIFISEISNLQIMLLLHLFFATVIIDNVSILTLRKKNETRSFITLLDALYECRVKLLIRTTSPPETLFFPDADVPA
jgi:hypothetical protein